MIRIEYNFNGNTIGVSLKRPKGRNQKWCESYAELQCACCGSTDLISATNGAGFAIACRDCPSWDSGALGPIMGYNVRSRGTEETYLYVENLNGFETLNV